MEITQEITNEWGVYVIRNIDNNKIYIGSSNNMRKRLMDHKRELNKNIHCNDHLQHSWNKYTEEKFECFIIEIINNNKTNKFLRERETFYIQLYKSYEPENGYNIVHGGVGSLGIKPTKDKINKISKSNLGKIPHNKGIPMKKEQRNLIIKNKTEKYGKKIDIYDSLGNFIETLPSIREVHRKYKIARDSITRCCKGISNNKTYIFRYHGDPIILQNPTKLTKHNQTSGPTRFIIKDYNTKNIIKIVKWMNEVILLIVGKKTRHKKLEKFLREVMKSKEKEFSYENKYLISFENCP